MYIADKWKDYELIDAGEGKKLERWGGVTLLRPDPLAVWPMEEKSLSRNIDARYTRASTGGGGWEYERQLPESWRVAYGALTFIVRPTGFKHTGLFPEQAVNWDFMAERVAKASREGRSLRVLNLFAYTGGATCALAAAGASVVHVDAAKGMVAWAKDNLRESGLSDKPVRFIVDDVMKFVSREKRRGREYDAILMDPPSYGRGPSGEMWKMEECIYPLVSECASLLSDTPDFFLINSYTTGLSATVLKNVLCCALSGRGGRVAADEVGLPLTRCEDGERLYLPCGSTGRWTFEG